MFQNAIVRTPANTLISGLTTSAQLGIPDYELALIQHQNYITALEQCGVEVTVLPALPEFPDSCFVEDVALLTEKMALLTRPGALSRRDEVATIESSINSFFKKSTARISEPGTLEAGDVLQIDNHFFIGLSQRTNLLGAEQMIKSVLHFGYTASMIELKDFLHLKTGVSYLGNKHLLVSGELIDHKEFSHLKQIKIDPDEAYAANSIVVNGTVLMPHQHPQTRKAITELGFSVIELEVSEFRKVDGGLSCLSLRF